MAFVVGISFAIALRIIGFAPQIELSALSRFYTLHWYAASVIFFSGIALLLAYPTKALTNPLFYLKLCALIIGLLINKHFQSKFLDNHEALIDNACKILAYASLLLWVFTLAAGRLLAYTYSTLLASRFY